MFKLLREEATPAKATVLLLTPSTSQVSESQELFDRIAERSINSRGHSFMSRFPRSALSRRPGSRGNHQLDLNRLPGLEDDAEQVADGVAR